MNFSRGKEVAARLRRVVPGGAQTYAEGDDQSPGERPEGAVFLLSTTHGAETPALAAAIATMRVCRSEPVVDTRYRDTAWHTRSTAAGRARGRTCQLGLSSNRIGP